MRDFEDRQDQVGSFRTYDRIVAELFVDVNPRHSARLKISSLR